MTTYRRAILFRLAALLLGLAPFVAAEGLLRLLDVCDPEVHVDPFVGFRSVRPLFVLNEDATRYEIPESRQLFFRPDGFDAKKSPNEFRIFCLGGSTVQGRPYSIETSFTTWLELTLQAAQPDVKWEVVNCGGVSYASYRLIPILEETLAYEPDLYIIYTGHNEFLEDRSYGHIKDDSWLTVQAQNIAARSRLFTLAHAGCRSLFFRESQAPQPANLLPTEVEALLDYQGGLQQYERNLEWQQGVMRHYEFNLRRMIEIARRAGAPVVLVNPVSNIRDCPPFKTQHRDGLDPQTLQRWNDLWEQARAKYGDDLPEAIELLQEAIALDDQHAGIYYDLGQCFEAIGQYAQAKQAFLQAKDLDVCPLRMLEPMHEAFWRVVKSHAVPVVDARALIEEQSKGEMPGNDWMVDHVHPSITGHQRIALALFEKLAAEGFVTPTPGWEARRHQLYESHSATLDEFYYLRGEKRLLGLRGWAAGRAPDIRPGGFRHPIGKGSP